MPFDSSRDEDLGSAAAGGPFAKLFTPAPATDEVLCYLIQGRALIADAAHWCQRRGYLNAKGEPTATANGDVVARCSWGALREIGPSRDMSNDPAFQYLGTFCGGSVIGFNDTHAHAEVLAMWDRAIAERRKVLLQDSASKASHA